MQLFGFCKCIFYDARRGESYRILFELTKVDLKRTNQNIGAVVHDNYDTRVRKAATLVKSIDSRLTYLQAETETLLNNEQLWIDSEGGNIFLSVCDE